MLQFMLFQCAGEEQFSLGCRLAWGQNLHPWLVELVMMPLQAFCAVLALLEFELMRFDIVRAFEVSLLMVAFDLLFMSEIACLGRGCSGLLSMSLLTRHFSLLIHTLRNILPISTTFSHLLVDDTLNHMVDFSWACYYTGSKCAFVHS